MNIYASHNHLVYNVVLLPVFGLREGNGRETKE